MKILRTLTLSGLVVLAGAACADLDVVNLNDPDRERALSTPGDVESLIAGSYLSWWYGAGGHSWNGSAPALSVAADQHSSSWGNFMMKDISVEPRAEINNDPSYGYAYVVEEPWYDAYTALSAVRDGLLAIDGGLEIGVDGEDTQRAIFFAKFVQGIAHGGLALLFDQAFIVDENTDLETAEMQPYTEVMSAAMTKLQEALSIAETNSFTLPENWMSGQRTNTELAEVIHGYMARFMAQVGRNPSERAAANWSAIIDHASKLSADHTLYSDDVNWYDSYKAYANYEGWARMDYRTVGPADTSGGYQNWLATPAGDRTYFTVVTSDQRISDGDVENDEVPGYTWTCGDAPFRPERGSYHFSQYCYIGWDDLIYDWTGDMLEMSVREMRLLMAEGYYRTGNTAAAVDIVNETRVANGGLPPVTASGTSGADCVPRTASGGCGDLLEALKYEKRLEDFTVRAGEAFFDDRGWGDLVPDTPIQFPVPGQELLVLLMDIYTFGGPGGDGSAPDMFVNVEYTPEVIGDRIAAIEARRARHTKHPRLGEMH
jgi:hypothetical protein